MPNLVGSVRAQSLWKPADAQIPVIQIETTDLKLAGTTLGFLIQETGIPLDQWLEEGSKKLLTFAIRDTAPMTFKDQNKSKKAVMTQHGLFRALHPELRVALKDFTAPTPIKIEFNSNHPIPYGSLIKDIIFPLQRC